MPRRQASTARLHISLCASMFNSLDEDMWADYNHTLHAEWVVGDNDIEFNSLSQFYKVSCRGSLLHFRLSVILRCSVDGVYQTKCDSNSHTLLSYLIGYLYILPVDLRYTGN